MQMTPLPHTYNPSLVALSVIIAILASYTALDLAGRVHVASGRTRALWILGGASGMGLGIWSMHFIGMLAFQMPTPVRYAPSLVLASVAVAIGASAFALWTASRPSQSLVHLALAAAAMGTAIAGMHYIGMAAMEVDAELHYDPALWWTSIAIAVVASFVALNLFRHLGKEESVRMRRIRGAAAVVMGFAIAGMHYTGMGAARFVSLPAAPALTLDGIDPFGLAEAVTIVALLGIGVTLLVAMLDRILNARTVEVELRAAKEAAEETTRAKSEFLSNMSHELRTPLNSVIGFANVILKNKSGHLQPQDVAYLERIVANGRHLLGLINGILDLSKIEAGKVELELTSVDIGTLVRETVLELEGQVQGRLLHLVADVPADLDALETDRAKLKQIVINLVGNAMKFTEKGSVTVRVVKDDRTRRPVRVDIVDTGVGIPADRLEAVFEAFKQADNSTARVYGGTGLGLTITRSLALLMGFEVKVESEVGVGSTFSVLLEPWSAHERDAGPRAARESSRTKAEIAADAAAGVRPLLTLVIDDDPDARVLLGQHLLELGCDVVSASSADEGIALARRLKPDVITLDVMMPRKNGIVALQEFKADPVLRNIPVVMISVVAEENRSRLQGAAEALDKPVTPEALEAVLKRHIRSDLIAGLRQRPVHAGAA